VADKTKNTKPAPRKKKKKVKSGRTGRKGKYHEWITEQGLGIVAGWKRNGLTDEQIAKNIGVRRETIYDWAKRFPNFSNAIKTGREQADLQVENALFKRAVGYFYDEVKEEYETKRGSDGSEREHLKKRTVTRKEVVPEVTAQIFWLKNRASNRWRNDDRLIVNDTKDEKASDLHVTILSALKDRKVPGFDDDEIAEIIDGNNEGEAGDSNDGGLSG
jgi:hypothetical protein